MTTTGLRPLLTMLPILLVFLLWLLILHRSGTDDLAAAMRIIESAKGDPCLMMTMMMRRSELVVVVSETQQTSLLPLLLIESD